MATEDFNKYRELYAKIKQLHQENAALRHENSKLNDELSATRQQRDNLLVALKRVEWTNAVDGHSMCPWCGAWKQHGHNHGCPRQAAIASVEAADAATD